VPSPALYPHQWSWDSAFIAVGTSHWSQRRAEIELASLFGGQWADGRIPHIIFNPEVEADAYFPGPGFWESDRAEGHPPMQTSGIVQPPIHARAALDVLRNAHDPGRARAFLRRLYPRLVAWHDYLQRERQIAGLGLAAIVHPWESGLDNSPLWDPPLARVPADPAVWISHRRRDLVHVGAGERPSDEEYARYIRLAAAYRDAGYSDRAYRPGAEFLVIDPLFNALWAWSEEALAGIAEVVGADPAPHIRRAAELSESMMAALFDVELRTFVAYDAMSSEPIPRRTVSGLVPIVVAGLPRSAVEALAEQLTSQHFGLLDDQVTGVPSYDLRAKDFDARLYWRGPTWLNTTWLVWRGLRTHGFDELAAPLATAMLELTTTSGFREYFDPHTRTGHGTREFGWSAALILDVLETLETTASQPRP
jgi:hypothetical protein